ncbi:hypothetical protein [Clostridium sp. CF011]|uniref:hypothetical protein n=1 Tax=Clostridium sp. CF011 TaxID=2843318 RepID=UPI00209B4524|nr:hypothetical protein [Clostridium sp. CF011]WAG71009.1 hypothetical protein LL036_06155 [Clostridium sp. CF011]
MNKIFLQREMFSQKRYVIYKSEEFEVTLFRYPSDIEEIELTNSKGKVLFSLYGTNYLGIGI